MNLHLIWRSWNDYKRFQALESQKRSIVFYAEDAASFMYFEPVIKSLAEKFPHDICYLTSEANDPILLTTNPKIRPFYIGNGWVRTLLFMNLKADVMVLTMPDLETFHLKRSKASPVHYVYIFHSIVSTHMIYRRGAFDHYDSIFCVGSHHVQEVRETEKAYGLKEKNLVEHGYGRLDQLLKTSVKPSTPHCVLVAPSWGPQGLLETKAEEITEILLKAGYEVIIRPHPVTAQKNPEIFSCLQTKFGSNPFFSLETDIRLSDSFFKADCLITDWSGAALEYAFALQRPVVFVDVPLKINNPEYKKISCVPLEIGIRERIGCVVSSDAIKTIPERIEALKKDKQQWAQRIKSVRDETVFNLEHSGDVGAQAIMKILDKAKKIV